MMRREGEARLSRQDGAPLEEGRAGAGLRAGVELVEGLLGDLPVAFAAFDPELRYMLWSSAMEALTGLPAASVLGRSALDVLGAGEGSEAHGFLRAVLDGVPCTTVVQLVPVAGEATPPEWRSFLLPLHDARGVVVGGAVVVRSQDADALLADRLREAEDRFRSMAECAPVLLWMSDREALCTFFNQSWLEFRGRTMDQERGFGWAEGVHPEDLQDCVDRYMEAFRARRPFEMLYRLARRDGAYRWILDRGSPRYTPAGQFAGFIGSCIDITDRRDAEDGLRRANDALQHRSREIEQFLCTVSHDLKAPVVSIACFLGVLRQDLAGGDAAGVREALDHIDGAVRRMEQGIQSLLDLTRVGVARAEPKDVAVGELVAGLAEELRERIVQAKAQVEVQPGLPAVYADPRHLRAALENLLVNALVHGCRRPGATIRVGAVRHGSRQRLLVRDEGPGIAPEHHERIFGLFERLNADTPGSGLGLAIVRRAAEQNDGRAWVESVPGQGATFWLELPAAAEA